MKQMSRRAAIRAAAAGGGLLGAGLAAGYALRGRPTPAPRAAPAAAPPDAGARDTMMGNATAADISTYTDLFSRHAELGRTVQLVPGGVRTVTEAADPALTAQLQSHVASMYAHLDQGQEVTCMSSSLPVLFRNSRRYRRTLANTARGVAITETSDDPRITAAIRSHAAEVTGFAEDGMPAMMAGLMGGQDAMMG